MNTKTMQNKWISREIDFHAVLLKRYRGILIVAILIMLFSFTNSLITSLFFYAWYFRFNIADKFNGENRFFHTLPISSKRKLYFKMILPFVLALMIEMVARFSTISYLTNLDRLSYDLKLFLTTEEFSDLVLWHVNVLSASICASGFLGLIGLHLLFAIVSTILSSLGLPPIFCAGGVWMIGAYYFFEKRPNYKSAWMVLLLFCLLSVGIGELSRWQGHPFAFLNFDKSFEFSKTPQDRNMVGIKSIDQEEEIDEESENKNENDQEKAANVKRDFNFTVRVEKDEVDPKTGVKTRTKQNIVLKDMNEVSAFFKDWIEGQFNKKGGK